MANRIYGVPKNPEFVEELTVEGKFGKEYYKIGNPLFCCNEKGEVYEHTIAKIIKPRFENGVILFIPDEEEEYKNLPYMTSATFPSFKQAKMYADTIV